MAPAPTMMSTALAQQTRRESFWMREFTGRRLVWNILYYLGHIGIFAYGWYAQASNIKLKALNGLKFSVWTSRGAGLCLGFDGMLLLLPLCRNIIMLIRPSLTWLAPLDENLWFHRQIAYSLLFFTIVHTTAHYVNFINVELTQVRPDLAWEIHYTMPGGFTGHVMLFIIVLMYTTAHHRIRNQCFEAFWYTHHLAFFFMLGLYTHATGCFVRGGLPGTDVECLGYQTWRGTIWGGLLYFMERLYREYRARRPTEIVGVLMHPSGAMEIRFKKASFKYRAGMWLYMQVPEVSAYQWHPFTISSAPDDPYVSVHIRQVGDWTEALGERLGCSKSLAKEVTDEVARGEFADEKRMSTAGNFIDMTKFNNRPLPSLRIDGPFGAPAEDVFNNEVAVLIGTGIGVTPFASILKNIWYRQQQNKMGALRRVEFIWVNRDTSAFEWFASLMQDLEARQTDRNFLRISTYLTQKLSEDQLYNIALNDAGAEFDAITSLRSRTSFGRPNFPQIFRSIREGIETGRYLPGRESSLVNRVAVFYCGPNTLAKPLKLYTKEASTPSVTFTFHKEHF